jgi:hypothetical protein
MESQLNPDAAEFVPSPTQTMPSVEEVLLAQSPSKGMPMEDITIPSQLEFQHEVSQRPSELDLASESPELLENRPVSKLPDLISSEVDDVNPFIPSVHLEREGVFSNILEHEQQNIFPDQQDSNMQRLILDDSEVTSTKAEYGDDSVSFLTTGSEPQKTVAESVSSLSPLEKSFTDSFLLETDRTSFTAKSDDDNELFRFNDVEVCLNKSTVEETALLEDGSMIFENSIPVCFEVQKELVPEMELKPERVELDSEGASSFDDSGSPLQTEDKQLEQPQESTTILDSPVGSPVSNLHPQVPEELTVTSQVEEPSLQDSLAADVPSPSAEYPISHVEAETVSSEPLHSPFSTQAPFWGSASPIPNATPGLPQALENKAQAVVEEFKAEACPREIPSPPLAVSDIQEHLNSENSPRPTPDETFAINEQCLDTEARIEKEEEVVKCQEVEVNNPLLDPFGDVTSQYDITDPRHSLKQDVCTVPSSVLQQLPIEDEVKESVVTQRLPATPVHVPEELPQLSNVEPPPSAPAAAEFIQLSEKVGDAESGGGLVAAVAAVATAAAAAGAVVAHEKPAEETSMSEKNVEAKKPTPSKDKKEPSAVKTKQTKTPSSPKTATSASGVGRVLQKSKPTSPVKPPSTTFRSSTPKKPVTSASPLSSRTTKSPAAANKPKPGATSPTKPLSSAVKPATVAPHQRPGTTTTKSSVLSNGDVPKPAITKKSAAPMSAKPQSRPATAPVTARAGIVKQSGTVTSRTTHVSTIPPRPKAGAVDGVASKSRPATTARNKVGSACDQKSVTDKKETANKQLPTLTVTNKSTTVTTTHSSVASAARRVTGVTKTTVTSSVSKVGPKKTASARTITGTRTPATASTKTTKTEVTTPSVAAENNEILQVQQVD